MGMFLSQRLQSPIHIAAEQGYTESCRLLLAAGANIDQREQVGTKKSDGLTPPLMKIQVFGM
jgi:ankyrin repeat protein